MRALLIIAAYILLSVPVFCTGDDDYYLKTNKSFEVYGAIFKELSKNYVLDIDPEALMNSGIDGMLSNLDPYTVFLDASEAEDIDVLTSGSYVGLGITVGTRDSMLTITGVAEGYSAAESGVRIGDRLYKIDSNVILYEASDEIRKFTRGPQNSTVELWLLRDGRKDTLKLKLVRKDIEVKNIAGYGEAAPGIGYIKLERFSRYSALEVKKALAEMKDKYHIKGLIIDLRNNPGGLLEAAVDISELFLPDGTPIVSTKGRNNEEEVLYTASNSMMHDTTLPLAVLINGNSASASEILAGAVQDQDRGIIVGSRSFGKGLVQTIIELPHKSSLKMTTARYYTPSGRCIQRLEYTNRNGKKSVHEMSSDSVFYTKNGRPVYESKGILPDSAVAGDGKYTDFIAQLIRGNHIFNFANVYASAYDKLPDGFTVNSALIGSFREYLNSRKWLWQSDAEKFLSKLKDQARKDKASKETMALIGKLEKLIEKEKVDPFEANNEQLKKLLDFEIRSRFLTESESIRLSLSTDADVRTAAGLLQSGIYKTILTTGTSAKNRKLN